MRKLAPLLAIIAGFTTILFSVISLLAVHDIIGHNEWVGKFKLNSNDSTVSFIIAIVIGFVQFTLGMWSWKKARGFGSFILMISFALSVGLLIYASTTANKWPISTIVALSISGLALIGVTLGFVKGNS